ncbi:MAG: hypothetical protein GX939_02745 [Clostridiaceae bacterium]|jgi:hypothetical protein|nr:hypothetical protein [Clostridiaceae bacterium]
MGFSLESAISLPCCLIILAESISTAIPLSISAHQSARLSAYASTRHQEGLHSCRYIEEEREGYKVYRVETEPQKMVESLSFVKDAIRTVGTACPPNGTHDMKDLE